MNTYRIGDALALIINQGLVFLIALICAITSTQTWAGIAFTGIAAFSALVFVGAALLNKRAREKERIMMLKRQHQMQLGIPPEEM